jgi:two-component sensor histidine kinase
VKHGSRLMLPMIGGLWTAFLLSYGVAFVVRGAPNANAFIAYILLCSTIGAAFSWLSWRFVVASAVRRLEVIGIGTVISLLLSAAAIDGVHSLIVTSSQVYFFGEGPKHFFSGVLMEFITFYFLYCLIFFFGLTMELSHRDAERRERLIQAEGRAHQAQLLALRLQINPHFLFNALNAVASLITSKRDPEALATLHRLSRFLRIVTETSPNAFSPLADELEMAEEYLSVEAIRFQERLNVIIEVDPAAAAVQTPNFILQPLIENAIKHGVGATEQVTDVSIIVRMVEGLARITVENRSDDPAVSGYRPDGLGVGLRNVSERLEALYGGAATLEAGRTDTGYRVVIQLPPSGDESGRGA